MQQTSFWKRHWPFILLGAFAVLFLGDAWFGRTILLRDFFFGDESYRVITARSILQGQLPLWWPLSQCGVPYAASPYNSVFYPFTYLFALPSVNLAMLIDWTFHFFLCAAAFYLLARHWKLSIAPALLGAVSFTFSTFYFAWIEFSHGFHSLPWGILSLYFVACIIDRSCDAATDCATQGTSLRLGSQFKANAGSIAGLAVALAMQIFSSTEFFYYFGLLSGSYGVARWIWNRSWKAAGVSLLWIGLAGLIGACLALPQLLLTFELMGSSVRAGETDSAVGMASEHPWHWLAMLLPYLFGKPGYPNSFWAPKIYEFSLGTCYVGILPVIGALFCWLKPGKEVPAAHARNWRFLKFFFAAAFGAGLLLCAGEWTPVYTFLHHWLPGLTHLRFPTKFFCWVAFALSMLGALGLNSLLACDRTKDGSRLQQAWWIATGFAGVFILGYFLSILSNDFASWLISKPIPVTDIEFGTFLMDYTWAVTFITLGIILLGLLVFRNNLRQAALGGIVALAFVNMWVVGQQAQPRGPASLYEMKPTELVRRIGKDPMHRYYTNYWNAQQYIYGDPRPEMWEWLMNTGATTHAQLMGLSNVAVFQLPIGRYEAVFQTMLRTPALQPKLLDMLSVRYLVVGQSFENVYWRNASRDLSLIEQKSALPRAFVATRWKTASGTTKNIWEAIADPKFDPHFEAVVEPLGGQNPPAAPSFLKEAPIKEVASFEDRGRFVSMQATASQKALLVLNDTWYPGWTVKVDGVEQPIYRANLLFRGVFLEPGTHRVEFSYWPTHYTAALWICALALAACGGLWAASRSQGKR